MHAHRHPSCIPRTPVTAAQLEKKRHPENQTNQISLDTFIEFMMAVRWIVRLNLQLSM